MDTDTLSLALTYTPAEALALGLTRAGQHLVPIPVDLPAEDRALLMRWTVSSQGRHLALTSQPNSSSEWGRGYRTGTPRPDLAGVLDHLRAEDARREKEKEQEKERDETRVAEALACPDEQWIRMVYGTLRAKPPLPEQLCSHPDVQARLQSPGVQAALAAAIEEQRAAAERQVAEARAEEQRKEEHRRKIAAIAIARYPHLARAAEAGYDVHRALIKALEDDVLAKIEEKIPAVNHDTDTTAWKDPSERSAPTDAMLDLREAMVAAVDAVQTPEEIGTWTVSRVVRIDVAPRGSEYWVTAVLATLRDTCGACLREITCSLEPLTPPGDSDEE